MNRKFLLFIFIFAVFFIEGCSSKNQGIEMSKLKSGTEDKKDLESKNKSWKETYIEFIDNFKTDSEIVHFSLRDFDNDNIPELIIDQRETKKDNYATLSIYSYNENLYKIGETRIIGAGGLKFSNNPKYQGLIHQTWGGGVEYYFYIFVDEEGLHHEEILRIDNSPFVEDTNSRITEFSNDEELINEVVKAYHPYEYLENILELYDFSEISTLIEKWI